MDKLKEVEFLLVEDNDSDAELTLRALRGSQLANEIKWLTDGQEALDYLFPSVQSDPTEVKAEPKLILLDLNLPRVGGLELLRIIKSDPRTRLIPVVVLTSSAEEKDIVESYHLGVNSYIVKPVEFDSFTAAVQRLGLYWMLLNRSPSGN
jgi:CheY-like chemotaxis protein